MRPNHRTSTPDTPNRSLRPHRAWYVHSNKRLENSQAAAAPEQIRRRTREEQQAFMREPEISVNRPRRLLYFAKNENQIMLTRSRQPINFYRKERDSDVAEAHFNAIPDPARRIFFTEKPTDIDSILIFIIKSIASIC